MDKKSKDQVKLTVERINRINDSFRAESIWIPESYSGTINPDFLYATKPDSDHVEIKGNSTGAFDLTKYMNSEHRILYILKEPYITKQSFNDTFSPDRGGHDQTEEYRGYSYDDFLSENNKTYLEIIRNCYSIVTKQEFAPIPEIINQAMDIIHGCVSIVNVNHFPGIRATSSNNSFIGKWARINENKLTELFELYNPTIIVGGSTLNGLYHHDHDDLGTIFKENVNVIWHQQIFEPAGLKAKLDSYYNDGHLFLNFYHPAARCNWAKMRKVMVALINWWEEWRSI